ncbi:Protein phosphatase 1L [Mortierella sp. 14UC]|nr:Protein phosphatase 1L [Mortierella sp. 14UC]
MTMELPTSPPPDEHTTDPQRTAEPRQEQDTTVDITAAAPSTQDPVHDKDNFGHAQEQPQQQHEQEQRHEQEKEKEREQDKGQEQDTDLSESTSVQPGAPHPRPADNASTPADTTLSEYSVAQGSPSSFRESLTQLAPNTPLPTATTFNLLPQQLKHPLFIAIARVLIVYGNAWQSAPELVGKADKRGNPGSISLARTAMTRPKARPKAQPSNTKRKQKLSSDASTKPKKRKPETGSASDTLSSGSSDDDSMVSVETDRKSNGRNRQKSTDTNARRGSPSSASTRSKLPVRKDSIPNGLRKLPKGYVYDTEINQSALMHLSVNPSQTGEYMQHLKGKNALENDFPDKRGEFGVDLTQEPSTFALEQQTGYTYPRLRNSGRERLPKADCEDGFSITDLSHNGAFLGRLFCVTDGHGGRACSSFVIATIPGAMQVILGKYRPKDLSLPHVQELVKSQITEAVRLIDKEYLDYKKQQYVLYKEKKITEDPGSDGTTLIVNVFIDKWIINLNLGDSRSLLSTRDTLGRWNVEFYSEDHTPALERLAQTIYANGGEFVTHDDKVIRFDPNLKNDKKHRQSLREARIRVRDGASNGYGIPYRTKNGQAASVNLGACIGDVLYKLDPINPVLSCKPDITFIDISNIQQGFLLMASDGLWDYVKRGHRSQDQNWTVSQFVGDKVDRGWNHQRIVCALSDRETSAGLYSESIQEYDDFTAILVTFGKPQLLQQQKQNQDLEDKQVLLRQQLLQEQVLLEQQQLMQKGAEEAALQQQKLRDVEMIRQEQANLRKLEAAANTSSDETLSDSSQAKTRVVFPTEVVATEASDVEPMVVEEAAFATSTTAGASGAEATSISATTPPPQTQLPLKTTSPVDVTRDEKSPSSTSTGSTESIEDDDAAQERVSLIGGMLVDDQDVEMSSC